MNFLSKNVDEEFAYLGLNGQLACIKKKTIISSNRYSYRLYG